MSAQEGLQPTDSSVPLPFLLWCGIAGLTKKKVYKPSEGSPEGFGVFKGGFTTPQRVYKSDERLGKGVNLEGFWCVLGGLDGFEGLHCLNETQGLEVLHTFV